MYMQKDICINAKKNITIQKILMRNKLTVYFNVRQSNCSNTTCKKLQQQKIKLNFHTFFLEILMDVQIFKSF